MDEVNYTKEVIVSKWIHKYIDSYLGQSFSDPERKVIIKIEYMPQEYIPAILQELTNAKESQGFELLVKVTEEVPNFEHLLCKEHETIVWLRNNIEVNQAVILVLSNQLPEGQSLKDIISVDESVLVSKNGINILKEMLVEQEVVSPLGFTNDIIRFLECYRDVTDIQLVPVVEFLLAVIKQSDKGVKALSESLPALLLFKEKSLSLSNKGKLASQLRKNYYLSTLRANANRMLDQGKLVESAQKFIQNEREAHYLNDIWKIYQNNEQSLFEDVYKFVYENNKSLFQAYFSDVESLFNFKEKRNLTDRINNVRDTIVNEYEKRINDAQTIEDKERAKREKITAEAEFNEAFNAITSSERPETIREIAEKYDDKFAEAGITKQLTNLINKLENPSEYYDIIQAILMEALILVESLEDGEFDRDYHFEVIAEEIKLKQHYMEHLNFHLNVIQDNADLIKVVLFEEGEEDLPEEIKFTLKLKEKGTNKRLKETTFKINTLNLQDDVNNFYDFVQLIKSNDIIGTIVNNNNKRIEQNLRDDLLQAIDRTRIMDPDLVDDYARFINFQEEYAQRINAYLNDKIKTIELSSLEDFINQYLNNVYSSYKSVQKVYSLFNHIGTTLHLDETETIEKMQMSLLHPIRLISYMAKVRRLNHLLKEFVDVSYKENRLSLVGEKDMKVYKEYLMSYLGSLAPSYVTTEAINGFYLLEDEVFGQGTYILDDKTIQAVEHLDIFTQEIQKVVQDYLSVYPYAKNSLNMLFMYADNEEYIKRAIEAILKNNIVEKLTITLYTEGNSATIHGNINSWIESREDLSIPIESLGALPKVEVNILPRFGKGNLSDRIKQSLNDYDIALFMNFLTNLGSNRDKDFTDIPIPSCEIESPEWVMFDEVGYLSTQGGAKYINYGAKILPEVIKKFYDLQYVLNKNTPLDKRSTTQLLRGVISTGNTVANKVYDDLHELFNWVVVYDKYIDPLIAKELSTKAQIIKYSIIRKASKETKILVSSADSINKIIKSNKDANYHERLISRLSELLKISTINNEVTQDLLNTIKSISGGLLLRSLGAGKFIHELLAMYLTLKANNQTAKETITVWASCDDLEWFKSKQKRPDLLRIDIKPNIAAKEFDIEFKLIELKLVHKNSYQSEATDALKQLDIGMETLQRYLNYENWELDKEIRLQSFYRYLMQARTYSKDELVYMENLKLGTSWKINKSFKKQADIYIYSHDIDFKDKELIKQGHYVSSVIEDVTENYFTRSYLLDALQISKESIVKQEVEEEKLKNFNEHLMEVAPAIGLELDQETFESDPELVGNEKDNELPTMKKPSLLEEGSTSNFEGSDPSLKTVNDIVKPLIPVDTSAATIDEGTSTLVGIAGEGKEGIVASDITKSQIDYPEQRVFNTFKIPAKNKVMDQDLIEKDVLNKKAQLERMFARNNVNLKIKDFIIGANVIRFICTIPYDATFNSVKNKTEEIKLWLRLKDSPSIFIDKDIIIDINRENPETIYFDDFMKIVREQLSKEEINKGTIVPIGLDPLKNIMYMDMTELPHLLVAGTTGSGKSVSLNAIILSMMCIYSEEEVRFAFIDPKQVEFSMYERVRHTEKAIVDLEEAVEYLEDLTRLMDDRYTKFREQGAKNLQRYNKRCLENGMKQDCMHRIIVVFDEFADFMKQDDKELVERMKTSIMRLGQKARAAGIHLIICTQSPKADVIDTNIRNNISARLCLKVADGNASNVVLDETGAEKLAGKGDYLFKKESEIQRGKSPFLDEDTQDELIEYFTR